MYWKSTIVPEAGRSYGYSGPKQRDCNRKLDGRHAFAGPPTWQSSYWVGLYEINVPRVPGSLGVHVGWVTGLAGWLLVLGCVVNLIYEGYGCPAGFN